MAKLIKNNRILFNNNVFPHEEASMKALLAKERNFKLIQAWDDKQIKSWSLPALLLQLLNDSRTINEMLKQREQAANLAVQQEQEEQADYEDMLQDREKFMQDTQTFWKKPEEILELMCKLLEDVRNIKEELAEYINSPSWNSPTFFYDDDEEYSNQYKEYLDKFPNAVTTVLPTKEPEYSLSMGYENLNTTPETESDEVTESSVKNLLPIPSEYEVASDDESECDVPIKDESSSVFTTFSNPLFDDNDDFTSSDDESLSDEDVPTADFKFDYLEEFSGAFMPTSILDEDRIRREHEEYISLMEKLFSINPFPRPLENFHTIIETLPTSPILIEDSDSQREEIDIFTGTDELLPPSIESDDYDSERDIHFLEELLVDDSISFPENESSNFDHQDDPSIPRPPPKPPDVEFYFDLEPNSGEVISAVINNIVELNEDECFDPGREIDVFTNVEDNNYFSFIFIIRIFLPYLIYPEVSPLFISAENEDTIFDPGISVWSQWHLIGMELSCALMFIQTLMKARLRFSFPFALPMDK
uniref:Reverse transcriptase domain-containing protein n=1 Tax=Tanacetum cinerariifolium TaxID=118510 RepID=A0A6L2M8M0_TANCI|nr:hypothetical protein [Tanacetum cinerariifolium]